MRPRHKAAENSVRRIASDLIADMASMRPRHKAAENISELTIDLDADGRLQ